jgi:nitrile hydratase subunit alpha
VGRLFERSRNSGQEEASSIFQRGQEKAMSKDHSRAPTGTALRVKALEALLEEKGLIDPAALDAIVDTFENKIGPRNGARVVAKAWTDPAFQKRLSDNATAAIAELGFGGPEGGCLIAARIRRGFTTWSCARCAHVIRGRCSGCHRPGTKALLIAVRDPRGVLKEFGVEIPAKVEVRVWDSSAEQRYVVIPERPAGTDGMNEEQLAAIVTRDSMVATAKIQPPRSGARR